MMTETNVKGLALLKEAAPRISRMAVFLTPPLRRMVGLEGRQGCGPGTGASGSIGACAQRGRVRQRLHGHRQGARRSGPGPRDTSFHRRCQAARGTVSVEQAAVALWAEASCAGRRSDELLARPRRSMAPRRPVRGQNRARYRSRRSARAATHEVRTCHQPEDRKIHRADNSAARCWPAPTR